LPEALAKGECGPMKFHGQHSWLIFSPVFRSIAPQTPNPTPDEALYLTTIEVGFAETVLLSL
jgi:hypothetical protein